jgi:hypothetical protein
MAIVNGYTTLAVVKASLRIEAGDTQDDALIEQAIESASRRIDGYCGRWFYKTASTAIPIFNEHETILRFPNDIANTSVTIRIDTTGDGTFDTTLVQGTDYILQPTNAPLNGYPYSQAVMIAGATFPVYYSPAPPTCEVTGFWGWNTVPNDVQEACILMSMRQFARLNAALGVVGFADMALQVRSIDPDIRDLLNPYRVLVGYS